MSDPSSLGAVALNCTLKPSDGEPSSTERLVGLVVDALGEHGVATEVVRVVDEHVAEGVTSDEGDGDGWPSIRQKIVDAQILFLATPIWLGSPSSVCRRVLERMDAFLGDEDDQGRLLTFGKVAVVGAVGNEDGAHNVGAQLYQGLGDLGFSLPPSAQAYWVGEAMGSVDFADLDVVPETVASTVADVARHAVHLARLLQQSPYPG